MAARPSVQARPATTGERLGAGHSAEMSSSPGAARGNSPVAEPGTISIHIGRLDVRANLEAGSPKPTPRPPPIPDAGPSLEDYLAGRRVR